MDFKNVPLIRSIGFELLKKVFGVYCVLAILISLVQAWIEYSQSRDRAVLSMEKKQYLVEEGLATAVWHLDKPLLNSLIKGILSHSTITGISVYDENGQSMAEVGKSLLTDVTESKQDVSISYTIGLNIDKQYIHSFDLYDPVDISREAIGHVVFYTNRNVVIEEVKPTLITLMLAAGIKTLFLWIVFIYYGRKLLGRPLGELIDIIRNLPVDKDSSALEFNKMDNKLNEIDLTKYALANLEQRLLGTLSELKKFNIKLSNTNVHLQRAVEQSPTISMILSPKGEVLYVTPSFTERTGYSIEDAQELITNYIENDTFIEAVNNYKNNSGERIIWDGEIKIRDKDGHRVYLDTSLTPIHCEDGLVVNYLVSANDITKLKSLGFSLKRKNEKQLEIISKLEKTQAQLIQAEKMASVGQLAAGVAHEINNPIGFVNSNLMTLQDYLNSLFGLIEQYQIEAQELSVSFEGIEGYKAKIDFDFIREDIPLMLDETQDGLDRVKKIVRDLMDFSRENNEDFVQYDLRIGLESTLNVAWHELKYRVNIVKEFNDVPKVECVPSQINQVFMNLLVNAAHAISEKGVITLRIRQVDNKVVIEVEDNGNGIAKEHRDKLFDPFFTTKPVGQGTGLGLSVSYGIIKKHNGVIEVDSEVGRGTCFSITLPIYHSHNTKSE